MLSKCLLVYLPTVERNMGFLDLNLFSRCITTTVSQINIPDVDSSRIFLKIIILRMIHQEPSSEKKRFLKTGPQIISPVKFLYFHVQHLSYKKMKCCTCKCKIPHPPHPAQPMKKKHQKPISQNIPPL